MTARFLALGDSYSIGEAVAEGHRWPVQLAHALRAQGVDLADPTIVAQTGWTTDELSAGITQAGVTGPYDLVTLLIGVNNQYRGRSLDEYDVEFRALLDRALLFAGHRPSHVIVLSIPDWGVTPFAEGRDRAQVAAEIDAFNAVNHARAREAGCHYVDVTPVSRQAATDSSLVASDGLHPSGAMYAQWAALVLPVAQAILQHA
ncbi:MAG TPA: SGNH/GDSL hydrolase family protein [Gemmatimonadaceae bacterium]|nr:SGNH/GDSL hydrolase family protein [Gemmatimonadaceae bacterium]